MEIREAKLNELEEIAVLMEQVALVHYEGRPEIFKKKSKEVIKNEIIEILENDERTLLIAIDEESNIKGVLIYKIKEVKGRVDVKDFKTLWIDELVVDKKCRKNGIGKLLMKKAEEIARIEKCIRLELNCWNFNEDAIKFYEKIGMEKQRIIMEKEIGGM